jgi:hypothetical protein
MVFFALRNRAQLCFEARQSRLSAAIFFAIRAVQVKLSVVDGPVMYKIESHRTAESLRSMSEFYSTKAKTVGDPYIAKDFKDLAEDFAAEAAEEDAKSNSAL